MQPSHVTCGKSAVHSPFKFLGESQFGNQIASTEDFKGFCNKKYCGELSRTVQHYFLYCEAPVLRSIYLYCKVKLLCITCRAFMHLRISSSFRERRIFSPLSSNRRISSYSLSNVHLSQQCTSPIIQLLSDDKDTSTPTSHNQRHHTMAQAQLPLFSTTYGDLCRQLASTASTVQWCRQKKLLPSHHTCVCGAECRVVRRRRYLEGECFRCPKRGVKRWCPSELDSSLRIQAYRWKRLSDIFTCGRHNMVRELEVS